MIKLMLQAQNQAIFLKDVSMATTKLHFQHLLLQTIIFYFVMKPPQHY
jgi:hypothetical protein